MENRSKTSRPVARATVLNLEAFAHYSDYKGNSVFNYNYWGYWDETKFEQPIPIVIGTNNLAFGLAGQQPRFQLGRSATKNQLFNYRNKSYHSDINPLISEVSFIVGFNNPQCFSNCFKKQFRKTPNDFKKESQKTDLDTLLSKYKLNVYPQINPERKGQDF